MYVGQSPDCRHNGVNCETPQPPNPASRTFGKSTVKRESRWRACSISPVDNSVSKKLATAFCSPPSCTTISDMSTWNRKPCNPSTTVRHEIVTHALGTFRHL